MASSFPRVVVLLWRALAAWLSLSFLSAVMLGPVVEAFPSPWSLLRREGGWSQGQVCEEIHSYNITGQYSIRSAPQLMTGVICNATYSGCVIADAQSYAVTVTTTTGVDLSFAEILGIGLKVEISISTANSEGITISEQCPPGYTCGLQGIATLWNVTGYKETSYGNPHAPSSSYARNSDCPGNPRFEYYEVHFPVLVNNTQKNAQAMVEFSICIVHGSVNEYRKPDSIPICPGYPAPYGDHQNFAASPYPTTTSVALAAATFS